MISFSNSEFYIDYGNDTFVMNGKPFRYLSGSAHYFRMPRLNWRDRLKKIRAAGLNAVSTYIEWSQHENIPGVYNFDNELDIRRFIKIAQEEDLFVILRPGPYICAERDMGGLPFWLLKKHPDVYLRTMDPKYIKYVERWMDVLFKEISDLLLGNGGPIILVQVENEYGSYPACDYDYGIWLRNLFKKYTQDKAVLFTTDGMSEKDLKCGKIPGVYASIDFGVNTNIRKAFNIQRKFEPKGPLICSEFYPGWLTHWGEKMAKVGVLPVIKTLKKLLKIGANVNIYMFYGGTNFGFTAGADYDEGNHKYQSVITSYDYDAPITESGDLTLKYYAIRDLIKKYIPGNVKMDVPAQNKTRFIHKTIELKSIATLFTPTVKASLRGHVYSTELPVSFEAIGQNTGYCVYETKLVSGATSRILSIAILNDFANIFIDENFVDILSREDQINSAIIPEGNILSIVVENLGRINYGGRNNDSKGILSNVTLGRFILKNWNISCYDFKNLKIIEQCFVKNDLSCRTNGGFVFYMTMFPYLDKNDFYIDVSKLSKGAVFVNNFNLGRYWSIRGPQYKLYVSHALLKPMNSLIIMDEQINQKSIIVKFISN